jgi:hypothetical protein
MSFDSAFETFGIPGVVAFGLGYIAYKIYHKYNFSIASYDMLNKYDPQKTLKDIWENGEQPKSHNHNWCKYYYGKLVELDSKPIWKINLSAVENGDIYIYTSFDELPPGLDDGKYFMMVKFKNLKSHTKVYFQKKCWCGTKGQYIAPKYRRPTKVEIIGDGVHYYEPNCSIGEEDGEGDDKQLITKEQIGIYIKPEDDQSITDLIVEEAYIGKKYWKYNLLPYFSDKWYLLVEPRTTDVN